MKEGALRFLVERRGFSREEALLWVEEIAASCSGKKRFEVVWEREGAPIAGFQEKLERAGSGEPLDYLLGEKEFFGAKIRADRRALIPRVETELLAEKVSQKVGAGKRLLDLCCGSGCLGISLKKKRPDLEVFLSDLSKEALSLARENASLNGVDVSFLEGDLACPDEIDAIVCNPPYIETGEIERLDPSVRDFEPWMALDGGSDGLLFYRRLAEKAPSVLSSGGFLFLEIGWNQGDAVEKIFLSDVWRVKERQVDFSGHSRFFFLEKQVLSPVS